MNQTKLNIQKIAMLCALPLTYVLFGAWPKLQGMIFGALLMVILGDIQKYGLKAMFILPDEEQVNQVFELIDTGNLPGLKKMAKEIPPA